jgi:hypothetical protein
VAGPTDGASDTLREALALHYRLRFDPCGLTGPERTRLRRLSREICSDRD